ncbi:MAG: leucine-rich repeat domain-containing protein [Prolixibacteraceae bacterium]|nr:leucine-rich repeat domain-containing protein [Prolixibacteraceae bacterium]
MKKILNVALAIILAIGMIPFMAWTASGADYFVEGDYWYTVDGGEATITHYTGSGGDTTLPSTLGGYPITKINAFSGKLSLTGVTIPSGVTGIGNWAFMWCSKLTSVTIPNTVTSIGGSAFYECGLTSINIPGSVTNIGEEAFYGCPIKSVTIPKSVETIGAHAIGFKGGLSIYTKTRNFKLYGYKNTAGHSYAVDNGFAFELIDGTAFENFFRAIANFFRIFFNLLFPF